PDAGRCAPLPEPPGAGARADRPLAAPVPAHAPEPRAPRAARLPVRGLHAGRLRAASRHQGTDRGVSHLTSRLWRSAGSRFARDRVVVTPCSRVIHGARHSCTVPAVVGTAFVTSRM